jgi:hypothetical protein
MKLKPSRLTAVILDGLVGSRSAEADRIREAVVYLPDSELRKLADAINTATNPRRERKVNVMRKCCERFKNEEHHPECPQHPDYTP